MSDFNPAMIYFILYESIGIWLWGMAGLAVVLLAGIVVSASKLRRAGRPMKRPAIAASIAGLIAAVAAMFAVPSWTLADIGALGAAIDYAAAFMLALVPATIVASLVFMMAAHRCVNRNGGTVEAQNLRIENGEVKANHG